MNHRERTYRRSGLALVAALLAAPLFAQAPDVLPFERTEDVKPCKDYDPLKQAFFGSTHVHTQRSFDASINLVPATPRLSYQFAKGEITMPGVDRHGWVTRQYGPNDPPLDWGTVTDHSEYFGAVGICQNDDEKPPGYYSLDCQLLRGFYYQPRKEDPTEEQEGAALPPPQQQEFAHNIFALFGALVLGPGSRNIPLPICNDFDCDQGELDVWTEMQDAAEEAYEPCKFTSFIGYEATSAPNGTTWHRNVIFRNKNVIKRPVTALDMAREDNPDPETVPPYFPGGQDPEKLWDGLNRKCIKMHDVIDPEGPQCDVLTIPHNSNLGGGNYVTVDGKKKMITPPAFFDPPDRRFAKKRQKWEPLVEIYQTKGSSECRWDPRFQEGVDTSDEHCAFELLDATSGSAAGGGSPSSLSDFPSRSWVRNILKDGLYYQQDEDFRVNPFKLGIVASNDNHNGTMGWHPENEEVRGHAGISDAVPTASATLQNSSGGHSVVWAEENTRDSIFTALRNKETYGTSGTRIVVRFFGGWGFPEDLCQDRYVAKGYELGVPMGGDLKDRGDHKLPSFVIAASMDQYIKTPLQQLQVVKGWVDKDGKTHEKVVTVAGNDRQAWVDNECHRTGRGYESLCTVWHDKEFDPEVPAFYYVRVLEDPVCRYSTLLCQKDYGINPLDTDCPNQLVALKKKDAEKAQDAAFCCSNESTMPIIQPVIQERAWTSPIWYTPPSLVSEKE